MKALKLGPDEIADLKKVILYWFNNDPPTKEETMHTAANPETPASASADEILAYERSLKALQATADALPELAPGESAFVEVPPQPEPEQPAHIAMDPTPAIDNITALDLKRATEIEFFLKGASFGGDLPRLPFVDDSHAHSISALVDAYDEARILAHELLAVRHQLHTSKNDYQRMERLLMRDLAKERATSSALVTEVNRRQDAMKSLEAERDHLCGVYEVGARDRARMIGERNVLQDALSRSRNDASAAYILWEQGKKVRRSLQRQISKLKRSKARR